MSRWLKALAVVSPSAAMKRARAMAALDMQQRYAGATAGRRGAGMRGAGASANTAIGSHLSTLRGRSRELVRDHWAFQRILDVLVSHSVGYGIGVRFDTGSDRTDRQATAAFEEWSRTADVTGELDFHGLTALAVRAMLEGGESVVRFWDLPASDQRRVKMGLQLWEGDVIDHSKNGRFDQYDVRLGVALGERGRREGYYLHDEHPGEASVASASRLTSKLTPRSELVHLYRILRPGQVRGVPVFAPILLQASDLGDLMDAVLMKTKIESCFSGFIRSPDLSSDPMADITRTDPVTGQDVTNFEPGMIVRLRPGEDINFAQPGDSGRFQPVYEATLYAMAAGAGVTYDQLTGDLRQANYSSLRAGKVEFRRMIDQLQWLTIVPMFMERVVERWVDRALLAGVLRPRRDGYRWTFIPPAVEAIDPKKDLEADILAVRSGRLSPQEFIAAYGRRWDEVVDDFSAFFAATDEKNLIFDIDPRKVGKSGSAQPNAPPADEVAPSASDN